jgi:hypothetical protein
MGKIWGWIKCLFSKHIFIIVDEIKTNKKSYKLYQCKNCKKRVSAEINAEGEKRINK